jgi:hypothetical protein
MTTNAKIGLALVGGYVLGRTKKARMALGLGMFLAGKRLRLDREALTGLLAGSPSLSGLRAQVRDEVLGATGTAAKGALTERVGRLADTLHRKTADLSGRSGGGGADGDAADEALADGDAADEEAPDEEAGGGDGRSPKDSHAEGGGGARGDAASKARRRAPAKRAGSARAGGSAAKSAARPADRPAGGGRAKAAGSARKAAGSGRKTATRTARSAGREGGGDRG